MTADISDRCSGGAL